MSARTGRFGVFGPGSGKANAAGAEVACAVMLLAGCGGSGGSTADAGAPVIRGDVAGTSSVTAVAGVGQVVVSWPESQTSSTQKVTGYEVQVSTDSGGTWAGAGTGCAKDTTTKSTALTCTATGLAAGTYSFRIATLKKNPKTKATKTTDFSAGSTGVPVIAAPGTPAKPTVVAGDSKVTVTVAAGTGGTPTSYTVTAYTAAGVVAGTACTVPGASGDCDVTGLANGTPYTVKATAAIGDVTSPVPAVSDSFTPLSKPGTPTVSAVGGEGKVTATMNAATGGTPTSYAATAYTTAGVVAGTCTVTVAPWSCPVTGLTNGTKYTVTATATNAVGTSGASAQSAQATAGMGNCEDNPHDGLNWSYCDESGVLLVFLDLTGVNMTGTDLSYADLRGADLRGANLTGANLSYAMLDQANLTGATLTGATLTGATLTGATLLNGATLTDANLAGLDLTDTNLTNATLTRAYLTFANLNGATLTRAHLTGVDLRLANLINANLTDADMTDANLTSAKMGGSNKTRVTWTRTTCPNGKQGPYPCS